MRRFWSKGPKRVQRMDSTKPLMENNNNDDYGFERSRKEQISQELQSVCSDGAPDYVGCSADDMEPSSVQRSDDQLHPQRSEPLSFPEPPADLDQHLDQHLRTVDEIVNSSSTSADFYCTTRAHLDTLLQNISTAKSCLFLMNWVSHRKEKLEDPELDLLDVWETDAQNKLLARVKEEISDSLEKILKADQRQTVYNQETYVQLYVDIIQCINAMPILVHDRSLILSDRVKKVCFQELQGFVNRYASEQAEILRQKAQTWRENMENPQMIHFLKTLRTCKELRQHVQTRGNASCLVRETTKPLETLETQTLELLKKIVTELAESFLKDYFKSTTGQWNCLSVREQRKRQCDLFADLKTLFPKLPYVKDEQTTVINQVYKVVAHSYFRHLIQRSQGTLRRHWSPDVGEAIEEDAEELHSTMVSLVHPPEQDAAAPESHLKRWNAFLLRTQEVLKCKDLDALKLIVAINVQQELRELSGDLNLLPKLLQWKGLSRGQVREVLEALPDSPPVPSSGSVLLRCCCCS